MRYFRSYPWAMQLLLFMLMMMTLIYGAEGVMPIVLTKMTGFSLDQLGTLNPGSPVGLISAMLFVVGISSVLSFLLPGLLFAYLSTPRPAQYLGLRAPGKPLQLVLVIFIMLGATPVLLFMDNLISLINFGPAVKAAQEVNDNMFNAFLNIQSTSNFIKVFCIMAIIPALGEEILFRGVIMRFVKQRSSNMVVPVLFTALMFALSHANLNGLVSIFLAGVLLAVIYNLTGSLWCSILAHLSFNGMQVTLAYMSNHNAAVKALMTGNSVPLYFVAGGAIVFALSFYLLLKNKTPLPPNWSDNFTPEELSQKPA